MISFVVPGRAQPGGSKRAFVRGGRAQVVDANAKVGAWKERVALACPRPEALLDGPLRLFVTVSLQRPAGHFGSSGLNKKGRETPHPIGKPDLTKYVRAIEDALNGVLWTDDARVVEQYLAKRWGGRDEVTITVEPLSLRPD